MQEIWLWAMKILFKYNEAPHMCELQKTIFLHNNNNDDHCTTSALGLSVDNRTTNCNMLCMLIAYVCRVLDVIKK